MISQEHCVRWNELLQKDPAVQAILAELWERRPQGFKPGPTVSIESTALNSAHLRGFEEAYEILQQLAKERPQVEEPNHLDTSTD